MQKYKKIRYVAYFLQFLIGLICLGYLFVSHYLYKFENIDFLAVYLLCGVVIYSIPIGILKLLYKN